MKIKPVKKQTIFANILVKHSCEENKKDNPSTISQDRKCRS